MNIARWRVPFLKERVRVKVELASWVKKPPGFVLLWTDHTWKINILCFQFPNPMKKKKKTKKGENETVLNLSFFINYIWWKLRDASTTIYQMSILVASTSKSKDNKTASRALINWYYIFIDCSGFGLSLNVKLLVRIR